MYFELVLWLAIVLLYWHSYKWELNWIIIVVIVIIFKAVVVPLCHFGFNKLL